jgi:hypothetical protein
MKRKRGSVALIGVLIVHASGYAASGGSPAPQIFGAAKVQEVYRVLLDRDALLLESINDVIKQKDIQDGEVLVTSGSVQECTYHLVLLHSERRRV